MRQNLQVNRTAPPPRHPHGRLTLARFGNSIIQLLDKRFYGIARGIGTAKILGRIHGALVKFQDLPLACSLTIVEVNSSFSTFRFPPRELLFHSAG